VRVSRPVVVPIRTTTAFTLLPECWSKAVQSAMAPSGRSANALMMPSS
jgi:hypothetical protein